MKIVEFVHANGSVKTSDLVTRFHISRQAALKELSQMVKAGLPGRQGTSRDDEIKKRYANIVIDKTLPGSFTGTTLWAWVAGL